MELAHRSSKLNSLRFSSVSVFFFGERLLDQVAGHVGIEIPALAQVLGDVPFLAGAERTERPAEKDERPTELVFIERGDVLGKLLPESLPREERIAIPQRESLEPAEAPRSAGTPGDSRAARLRERAPRSRSARRPAGSRRRSPTGAGCGRRPRPAVATGRSRAARQPGRAFPGRRDSVRRSPTSISA